MPSEREPSKIYTLSQALKTIVNDEQNSFSDIRALSAPDNATAKYDPISTQILKEVEEEYQKIASTPHQSNHAYKVVLFRGESTLGTNFNSILVPVVVIGNPRVKGLENVSWDGNELLYISGEIVITLSESERLGAWVVSFPKS